MKLSFGPPTGLSLAVIVSLVVLTPAARSQPAPAGEGHAVPEAVFASVLANHCADCHADGADEGGFAFDKTGTDLSDPATFAVWQRVFDRVRLGEMPPKSRDPVPAADKAAFAHTLGTPLGKAHAAVKGTVYRRLNRREYQNTMNDIFGTDLDLESRLPEDGRAHEFDNVGAALGLSMAHLQQYLDAADAVMDAATATTEERPPVTTTTANYAETREGETHIGKVWKKLPDNSVVFFQQLGYPSGMLRGSEVRPPGRYTVRVTGYAYQSDAPITFRVGGTSFLRGSEKPTYGFFEMPPGKPTTVEFEAVIRERYMIDIDPWGIDTGNYNFRNQDVNEYPGPGLAIQKVELIGPLYDEFPTRGHNLLFDGFQRKVVKPARYRNPAEFELTAADPAQAATAALTRIAEKAFRRPVRAGEIERYAALFRQQRADGASVEAALKTAAAAVFCSPDFLFLAEPAGPLGDYALASRLSYFLTRTLPDEPLLQAAAAGKLSGDPAELAAQARRLLADPRHDRFVADFCDAWLNLRDIEFTSPDRQLFPEYDQYLQDSMLKETRGFVDLLIDKNLPVTNLVKSDFALLNDRLAEHYGIDGVSGPRLRPVPLPEDSVRGGLLTQASVLKVTANGTNTSPVVRGVWVMDRILGQPPEPPPPGIPGVEPDIRGATTLRELLDKHRDLVSCRSCHAKIDPPGFALESFDPIGGYRERFRSLGDGEKVNVEVAGRKVRYKLGPPVDASGELPNGTAFAGYTDFRDNLAADPEALARALATKLMTFATGREMGFSDRATIDAIVAATKADGYRVRDILENVVASDAFRNK